MQTKLRVARPASLHPCQYTSATEDVTERIGVRWVLFLLSIAFPAAYSWGTDALRSVSDPVLRTPAMSQQYIRACQPLLLVWLIAVAAVARSRDLHAGAVDIDSVDRRKGLECNYLKFGNSEHLLHVESSSMHCLTKAMAVLHRNTTSQHGLPRKRLRSLRSVQDDVTKI